VHDRRQNWDFADLKLPMCASLGSPAAPTKADPPSARLNGFDELGGLSDQTGMNSGAILTKGKGEFKLHLDKSNSTATYELTYSDLTSTASMAHIHFGKVHVPGSIMIWLCQTTIEPGPAGTPTCPEPGGTVTGTITASSVQAIPTQNVTAGDFDALVAALESNTAYANIHSVNFETGELRGQVLPIEGKPFN
jgi:hypothetical protein